MEWPNLLNWPTNGGGVAQITIALQPGATEEQRIAQVDWADAVRHQRLRDALHAAGLEFHDA
jgi:hypothetical protein